MLGLKSISTLADALYHNTSLVTLDMHGCKVSDEAGALLGPSLDANAHLEVLNASWNDIRDGGGVAIAAGLELGRLLQLDLSFNGLSDASAEAFGACLASNNALTSLDLSHNRIGGRGASVLAESLPSNGTLVALRLGFNPIGYVRGRGWATDVPSLGCGFAGCGLVALTVAVSCCGWC